MRLLPLEEQHVFKLKLFLPFVFYLLIFILFFFLDYESIISYSVIYISASAAFIFLCLHIFKIELFRNHLFLIIVSGVILRIIFLFVQPIGSDDFYRYVWDGKVLANGINPYQFAPADEELINLHSDSIPEKVTFPKIKTIYPPLSLILFYFGYLIGGESYWGIKILLLLFELASISGLFFIIKKLQLPQKHILFYVLSPLPVFQFFIDAHVDGFGLTFIIFSILFYITNRKSLSLIFIGLSICIKPLGLILLPLFFLTEKGIPAKIKTVFIPLITCLIFYIPFISSSTFDALSNFTVNWSFNGFVFEIINYFVNNNQSSRIICGILFLIVYSAVLFSSIDYLNKIYLSVFLLLIFSPIVHPWYTVWLAVLLPFIPRWSGIFYTSLVSLTVFTIINYQLYDVWKNYPLVLILEYVPVVIIFFYELRKGSFFQSDVKSL
jgi:alpha-1,6-mannosyltransferase